MASAAIASFHKIYDQVNAEYEKKDNIVTKWTIIAAIIHENHGTFLKIFRHLQEKELKKLEYTDTLKNISGTNEMDTVRDIITNLHNIVYDLCSSEGNYYFALDGDKEMIILQKPLTYYINISKRNGQNILFHAFMLVYSLESLFHSTFYVGLDFEYTYRVIKLAQINFEHKSDRRSIIMIVGPTELEKNMTDDFIETIMCNSHCKKILHGSDSLDYPYIRDKMMENVSHKIIEFTNSMVDTRFICEYYKLSRDEPSDNKCSLYDAFVYFGVITPEKLDQFTLMMENMGHPSDRVWDIHNLSKAQELYVQYDVLFLKYFYFKMISMATNDGKNDNEKKKILTLYKHIIYELTQFIYLENSNITTLLTQCKEEVDPCNNYMIRRQHGTFKLIDIFSSVTNGIMTEDADIDMLSKVKAFSRVIALLLKKLTYTIISQKYTVQKTKTVMWGERLENDFVFDFFKEMPYIHLHKLFKDIEKILATRIKDFAR